MNSTPDYLFNIFGEVRRKYEDLISFSHKNHEDILIQYKTSYKEQMDMIQEDYNSEVCRIIESVLKYNINRKEQQ